MIKSFALSIKASYDYTASKMKDMITLTENVVNYLENRAFTTQDKIDFTIGIGENLEKNELVFFCLIEKSFFQKKNYKIMKK